MAEIGIKELQNGVSRVVDEVESGQIYVVTKRGRSIAAIVPIDEAEDVVLANGEEFSSMRRNGREEYRRGDSGRLGVLD